MSRDFIMLSTPKMTDEELRSRVEFLVTHKREGNEEFELRICEEEIVARFLGSNFKVNDYGFVEKVVKKDDRISVFWFE